MAGVEEMKDAGMEVMTEMADGIRKKGKYPSNAAHDTQLGLA